MYGYRVRPQTDEFRGLRFSFARGIEENFALAKRLVKEIVRRGGKYSFKLSGCNVFVSEDGDDSMRSATAQKLKETGQIREIYPLSQFESMVATEEA